MHLIRFWSCKFQKCAFTKGMWCNIGFRESTFQECSFYYVELEDCMLIGCKFTDVTWNGGNLIHTYFDWCTLDAITFTETEVRGIFHDCTIWAGAFNYIVEGDDESCITISSSSQSKKSEVEESDQVTSRGQDPLQEFVVNKQPTRAQMYELDRLLTREKNERPFQIFLEKNPEVLSVAVTKGHHGIYYSASGKIWRKARR